MRSFVLVTLDSVPWSTYLHAETPFLDSLGPGECARSHADNTIGSHATLFAGHFPHSRSLDGRRARFGPRIGAWFGEHGYYSVGAVAMPYLSPLFGFGVGFESWKHTADAPAAGSYIVPLGENLRFLETHFRQAAQREEAVFAFLNVGETHSPYWTHVGEPPEWAGMSRRGDLDPRYPRCGELARAQRRALEWVDGQLAGVAWPAGAVFYVTSDHGECFGEDDLLFHTRGSHGPEVLVPAICSDWSFVAPEAHGAGSDAGKAELPSADG